MPDTVNLPHPLFDLLLQPRRRAHLLVELTAAGMPDAAKAVGAGDWAGIIAWIESNLPAVMSIITALIALLGGA